MSEARRIFHVRGYRPALGAATNAVIRAFDLGLEGAFVSFSHTVEMTLNPDVTPEQLSRQPDALRHAYEAQGRRSLEITELPPTP